MAKEAYKSQRFTAASLDMISTIDDIIVDYMDQGYTLTVRQLYYQLVAKDRIPNNVKSYNMVKGLVNDARLAGLLDWDAIEDRTREFIRRSRWESGSAILDAVADQFHMDHWVGQTIRVFALVEKEALAGVLERVCNRYDVPLLAARGYPSVSVLREFVEKDINPVIAGDMNEGRPQGVLILHLGDHDPSGIDMTRDIKDRLTLLMHGKVKLLGVDRIALNMDQVDEQSPPPNPAKTTDARFESYRREYGDESWELDALSPSYLNELVERKIKEAIDKPKRWKEREKEIRAVKLRLTATAAEWRSE